MNIKVKTDSYKHIVFDRYYPDDDKTNSLPKVIMIHGMCGGAWYFKQMASFLAGKGLDSYVPDLRGHGRSAYYDVGSIEDYVEDVRKVAEFVYKQHNVPMVFMGHSMGGLVTQKFTAMFPELVKGIVLLTSAPPKGISVLTPLVIRKMIKHMPSIVFNRYLYFTKNDCFSLILNNFDKNDPEAESAAIKIMRTPESGKAARELAFSLIPVDERKINCPILVVSGVLDKIVPISTQLKIKEKYSFSDYFQFERGHMLMLERGWEEVISKIYDWINLNSI